MTSPPRSIPDHYQYHGINLHTDSVLFFAKASRYYADLLEKDLQAIEGNALFAELVGQDEDATWKLRKEIERFRNGATGFETRAKEYGLWGVPMTHGTVRSLKSVGKLYLRELRSQRNNVVQQGISATALEAIDTKLARFEDLLEAGVFADAELKPLLVESYVTPQQERVEMKETVTAQATALPALTPIYGIEILDSALRSRCLPLLQHLSASLTGELADSEERAHHFDMLVRESVSIVEHRIRTTIGADSSSSGIELVTDAFSRKPIQIQVSNDANEQSGVHLMFMGFFKFIRNSFAHRLIPTNRERAIQILAMTDYLLHLIDSAGKMSSNPQQP